MTLRPETPLNVKRTDDGRQFAPSTPRNKGPILELLLEHLGDSGRYLEIASGTGEHITHFAAYMPDWQFHPTEADPARLGSIMAWIAYTGVANVSAPIELHAAKAGWGKTVKVDAISMCNLFHLISTRDAKAILYECAQALAPKGTLILYGPFMRGGILTSDGDKRFHANITRQNPEKGYKNDSDMLVWVKEVGLTPETVVEMPANNLAFIATKQG